MKNVIIPLESYTAAKKAAHILAQHGIRASVVKTGTGRNGCTFGIRTSAPPDEVCRILGRSGIRCGTFSQIPPAGHHRPGRPGRPGQPDRPGRPDRHHHR